MDERQRRIVERLHLNERDFEPSMTANERMDEIEDAVLEIAEIVGELNNG